MWLRGCHGWLRLCAASRLGRIRPRPRRAPPARPAPEPRVAAPGSGGAAVRLTEEHTPADPAERDRVVAAGGALVQGRDGVRVGGVLQVRVMAARRRVGGVGLGPCVGSVWSGVAATRCAHGMRAGSEGSFKTMDQKAGTLPFYRRSQGAAWAGRDTAYLSCAAASYETSDSAAPPHRARYGGRAATRPACCSAMGGQMAKDLRSRAAGVAVRGGRAWLGRCSWARGWAGALSSRPGAAG